MSKKVAIIGAGLGGLSAAVHLAAKGYEVDIYEKNDDIGGKLGEVNIDGFRFDTGPSVVTMIDVIKDLFITSGKNPNDYLRFKKLEIINKNFFDDGCEITSFSDFELFKSEISKIDSISATNLSSYFNKIESIYRKTSDIFLFSPLHEVNYFIKSKKFPNLLDFTSIDAFTTMHNVNSEFFPNPKIQQIFDRYATYNGSSPYLAPGTLNLIAFVELVLGAYYIEGGIFRIVDSIKKLCEELNVRIHTKSMVDKIIVTNNKAKGIKIGSDIFEFDYIISNSDVVYTYSNLIDGYEYIKKKTNKLEPSISGMVFLWGIDDDFEILDHHNVFYANDYYKEFQTIFEYKSVPEDLTVYVAITSKNDKSHAPAGKSNFFVLVNMPYNVNQNWVSEVTRVRQLIINKLLKHGIDIRNKIIYEHVYTPKDLESRFLSNKGSIYGISSNSMFTAFKRYGNRARIIKNLFFTGGSVHPGGGIPLVILSGKNCASIIDGF